MSADPCQTLRSLLHHQRLTDTGLGLWEIIYRHRGLLRVRSSQSPEHHGTTFNIFLPFDAVVR
ncbi:hypothetical protein [Edaphobacter modestus]|uniref:hypothetical protein n=1 Tax=Edaphobacter modestus TaxID=388466 RepID=UPI00102AF5D1|nr:hypothetical protein [Edaphobacter modestus]